MDDECLVHDEKQDHRHARGSKKHHRSHKDDKKKTHHEKRLSDDTHDDTEKKRRRSVDGCDVEREKKRKCPGDDGEKRRRGAGSRQPRDINDRSKSKEKTAIQSPGESDVVISPPQMTEPPNEKRSDLGWKPSGRKSSEPEKRNGGGGSAGIGLGFYKNLFGSDDSGDDDNTNGNSKSSRPSNEGNGEYDEGESGEPSAEKDGFVPVIHPEYATIERRLGPKMKNDDECYLCDKTMELDESRLPQEIRELKRFITTKRKENADKVVFAHHVKMKFEELVRRPHNAVAGSDEIVPEWTLRSIYYHLTRHDGSMESLLERHLGDMDMMLTVLKNNVYVAPTDKVLMGRYSVLDLRPDDKKLAEYMNLIKLMNATATLKERIRTQQDDQPGGIARGGGGFGGAKGKGGSKTVRTSVNEVTLNTLLRETGISMGPLGGSNSDSRSKTGFFS